MMILKSLRNKRFGPGGGTRQLHQVVQKIIIGMSCAMHLGARSVHALHECGEMQANAGNNDFMGLT